MLVHNISRSDHPLPVRLICSRLDVFRPFHRHVHRHMSHRIDFFRLWGRLRWSRSRMNRRRPFLTELLLTLRTRFVRSLTSPVHGQRQQKLQLEKSRSYRGPVDTNTVVTRPQGASVKRCVFCFRPPWVGARRGKAQTMTQ